MRMMTMTKKAETCQSTTWMPVTRMRSRRRRRRRWWRRRRRRRRTAGRVRPVRAPPLTPPAPALGPGPGKRVQVKGNSRQNVSISSIFLLTLLTLMNYKCPVCAHFFSVYFFYFVLCPFPSLLCVDWMIPSPWWNLIQNSLFFSLFSDCKHLGIFAMTWNVMNWVHIVIFQLTQVVLVCHFFIHFMTCFHYFVGR